MKVAVLGAGTIGKLLITALLESGHAAADIVATTRTDASREQLSSTYGIEVLSGEGVNAKAIEGADVVVLSVKPQVLLELLDEIASHVRHGQIFMSMAAGISTKSIESKLHGASVVRVMPNTPALVGEGVHGLSAGMHITAEQLTTVEQILDPTGLVVYVDEELQDALTAVSGSGPAYLFLFVESMIEAGISLGLSAQMAQQLAVQTLVGAGELLQQTGDAPEELRARVTSKGGTTAAAVQTFEDGGLRDLVRRAMTAARDRSKELGG